jgi:hypothetical protein
MNTEDKQPKVNRVGSTAQRLAEKPYEKRLCRIECYPSCVKPGESYVGLSVEEWVDFIDEVGVEVQVVDGEINRGTPRFRSKMIPPHANVDNDRLPRFLGLAHQRGILILSYYPVIYTKPLKPLHPEWLMQFLDNGRPEIENLGWFCFNSPYRDWLPEYLIEWLDNLDIDGFYFDDTNYGSHEERPFYPSCCCRYCEQLFREETGLEIPRKVDFDSLDFRHFVNWRYEKMKDFMHHLFRQIRAKYPDVILDMNSYIRPTADWTDGHPLNSFHLEDVGGYFFVETFRTLREPNFTAKVLRSTGTPFGLFRNVTQSLQGFGGAPYPETFSPAIAGLAAIANGGAPCGNPFDGPTILHKDTVKSVFSEFKKRVDYIKGDTVKYVALHYSQQNRDFRPSEIPKNTGQTYFHEIGQKDAYGAYEILNRSHLLFDFVLDERLNYETLSQYRLLFLSNSACLSDAQCEAIRRFVYEGGTLIATHETSLLDELGRERGKFALSDVLGVEYRGARGGTNDHSIIYVPHDAELSRQFGYVICFYGQESAVSVLSDADVHVLCTRSCLEEKRALNDFDPRMDYDSSEPAITVHRFGKGKAIYICGDVGGAYMNNPYPPLKRLIADLVKRTLPPIEFEMPEAIEVTAAHRGANEVMIHLLNNPTPLLPWRIANREKHDEEMTTFLALREVNPIRNIRVRFNDFAVKSARLPLQETDLEVSGNTAATVVVPTVSLHEVLLVEYQD